MHSNINTLDLLFRSKGIVEHMGLYIGNNQVLHCQPANGVTITSFSDFSEGKEVKLVKSQNVNRDEAFSRLQLVIASKQDYKLFSNNCEHVAHFILYGEKYSPQIQSAIVGSTASILAAIAYKKSPVVIGIIGGVISVLLLNIAKSSSKKIKPQPSQRLSAL